MRLLVRVLCCVAFTGTLLLWCSFHNKILANTFDNCVVLGNTITVNGVGKIIFLDRKEIKKEGQCPVNISAGSITVPQELLDAKKSIKAEIVFFNRMELKSDVHISEDGIISFNVSNRRYSASRKEVSFVINSPGTYSIAPTLKRIIGEDYNLVINKNYTLALAVSDPSSRVTVSINGKVISNDNVPDQNGNLLIPLELYQGENFIEFFALNDLGILQKDSVIVKYEKSKEFSLIIIIYILLLFAVYLIVSKLGYPFISRKKSKLQ